jgi:hypothetical protein
MGEIVSQKAVGLFDTTLAAALGAILTNAADLVTTALFSPR